MSNVSVKQVRKLLNELTASKVVIPDELLMRALGEESWLLLQQNIQHAQHRPVIAISTLVTNTLRPYVELLAKADRLDNRAELLSTNVLPSAKKKMQFLTEGQSRSRSSSSRMILRRRAEMVYEQALETLEELLDGSPDILNHLDRPVSFDCEKCNVWPDPVSVPRLINSRSQHNQRKPPPRKSIRSLKTEALRSRLEELQMVNS